MDKYKIVYADNVHRLQTIVNEHIDEGYLPLGGFVWEVKEVVDYYNSAKKTTKYNYYQTLVLSEIKENEEVKV